MQHDNSEQRENLNAFFLTRKEKPATLWQFGKYGTISANTYLEQIGSATMQATYGFVAPFDIAIWGYGITRSNANAGTVEIRDNGAAVVSIVMGANLLLANYINEVTITAGNVMTAYWNSANLTIDLQGYIYCYVRP